MQIYYPFIERELPDGCVKRLSMADGIGELGWTVFQYAITSAVRSGTIIVIFFALNNFLPSPTPTTITCQPTNQPSYITTDAAKMCYFNKSFHRWFFQFIHFKKTKTQLNHPLQYHL